MDDDEHVNEVFEESTPMESVFDTFEEQNGGNSAGSGGEEEFEEDEDIPMVSVNGKMIPLNEVQEEDQRNMTTDEYKVTKKKKEKKR